MGVEMQSDAVRPGGWVDLPAGPSTVITAGRGQPLASLREVWQYRELLYFLVWRDLKVRYKQTVLGGALGRPAAAASAVAIFTVVFGMFAKRALRRRAVPALRATWACCPGSSSPSR